MLTIHPRDALVVAHDRARRLRNETAAVRLLRPSTARHALAALCSTANRLDRRQLAHRPA